MLMKLPKIHTIDEGNYTPEAQITNISRQFRGSKLAIPYRRPETPVLISQPHHFPPVPLVKHIVSDIWTSVLDESTEVYWSLDPARERRGGEGKSTAREDNI